MSHSDISWMSDGLCAEIGPRDDVFFPRKGQNTQDQVKPVCDKCEVKEQCAQYAIDEEILFGWWGGKSPSELRKLRKSLERRTQ